MTMFSLLKSNRIIQITIVMPEKCIPYYEWLNDFPDLEVQPETPLENWTEHHSEVNQIYLK